MCPGREAALSTPWWAHDVGSNGGRNELMFVNTFFLRDFRTNTYKEPCRSTYFWAFLLIATHIPFDAYHWALSDGLLTFPHGTIFERATAVWSLYGPGLNSILRVVFARYWRKTSSEQCVFKPVPTRSLRPAYVWNQTRVKRVLLIFERAFFKLRKCCWFSKRAYFKMCFFARAFRTIKRFKQERGGNFVLS